MLSRHCNMAKAFIRAVHGAFGQLIMTSLAKQFTNPQILSITKLQKLRTDVYFTNYLNHWPQRHCDKKASVDKKHEGTVGQCDVTIASGRLLEPTTVGSLWLENDLHENELEFEITRTIFFDLPIWDSNSSSFSWR